MVVLLLLRPILAVDLEHRPVTLHVVLVGQKPLVAALAMSASRVLGE
jgi:hypothetical protein